MASCLGIYVDKNIIKYAKISKEKDNLKIDAFGIKIYSDFEETMNQIVSETFSFKDPISVNISDEVYNYFYMSDLLNKKDLNKAIETEFESVCFEKKYNVNALESRYVLVNDPNDKEKIKVIHVSENKMKITKLLQDFDGKKLEMLTPISLSIPNIVDLKPKENALIVNIEDVTTITTTIGQKVYDIQKLSIGASNILEQINEEENSYLKAYEICKNTTIYTMEGKDLEETENIYLEKIVPTLYNIATQVREIANSSLLKTDKVYITGTASVINNIDLYFEEILNGMECEILKPFFIEDSPKINMKDYIEVNSAISLALQGLGYGIKNINFNKRKLGEQIKIALSSDVTFGKNKKKSNAININFNKPKVRKWIGRETYGVLLILVIYIVISKYIKIGFEIKNNKITNVKSDIDKQIQYINQDKSKVDLKISEYDTLITNLQNVNDDISAINTYRNKITIMLSEIMNIIPKEVQLISIENPSGKNIVINAQSKKYEQLAYFKALLKSNGVLEPASIVSSGPQKESEFVKIIIEGELP